MTESGDHGFQPRHERKSSARVCKRGVDRWSPIRLSRFQASLRQSILILTFFLLAVYERERIASGFGIMAEWLDGMADVSPPLQQSLEFIEGGSHSFHGATIRYPHDLIEIFIQGGREQRDVLANFETLDRAWREASPNRLLKIRWVFLPVDDPCLKGEPTSWPDRVEIVDHDNFEEMRPLLGSIRDLICETEGDEERCGFGTLFLSGYPAEPEEADAGHLIY